ncbi:MAG: T9SS type A sorting domain-containing protein [Ignavibacterium album]|uniref:T9SS type A sorting domain-containing protein n=1 Tax=Ignavibacterium album TaxID=591197 RepID=UPI0026EB52F9|nr:T9SS type A sorting domain-containing protein [Ignavibacterium album]MCX8104239.1 T9SS type A sorting domain-containing protein [Ignavibacterium album]
MKSLNLLIINFIILINSNVFSQWQSLNGPYGGNVTAVGKFDNSLFCSVSDETIYSNNNIDIFTSTDNGNNWNLKSQLTGTLVEQIVSTNSIIFAQSRTGTFDYYLYKSTDVGNSWELVFDSLYIFKMRSEGDKIYVPTSQGLMYSSNNGISWNNISSNLPTIALCSESFNGTLYVGLPDSGVYKSTNNGISWSRSWANGLTRTIRNIFSFNNILFASEGDGGTNRIYKSTDNGVSWIQTSFFPISLNYYYINDIKVSTTGIFMSVIFRQCSNCLLEGGILFSSDGNNWELRRQGLLPNLVNKIELINSHLFVGTSGGGLFKSTNNGTSWDPSSNGIAKSFISHFTFSAGGAEWAAGIRNAGVFVSADSGFNWIARNNGLDNLPNPTVLSSIVKGTKWFIGTESNGIFTSTNQGNEWISSGLVGELPITAFALKGTNEIIVTRLVTDGVYRSTDDGNFWEQIMSGFVSPGGILAVAIGGAGNIFVGNASGYVLRSTNNGINWTGSEVAFGAGIRFLRQVGLKWFAATTNGIYRSTNFGVSWELSGLEGNNVNFIAIKSSTDTLTLFASTNDSGVFFSTDNGTTWFSSNSGLPIINITGIRSTGTYLYAGTGGEGLWRIKINDLITNVDQGSYSTIPSEFNLSQNFPNPFNPSTKISWQSPVGSRQTLKVYDILGNEVATLVDEYREAGKYEIEFDSRTLSAGIYFYRLQADNFVQTKKMILIK